MQGKLVEFIILCLFIIGCQSNGNRENEGLKNSLDKVVSNYNFSNDPSYSIKERLKYIDKAYQFSSHLNPDTSLLKILSYKAKLHNKVKEVDSAIIYSRELLNLSQRMKDSFYIGKSYFHLAYYYEKLNINDSAYYYYNSSIRIFLLLKDSIQVGNRLRNLAILQSDLGDYSESDNTAIQALKFLENSGNKNSISSVYNCLAVSSKKQNDFNEAIYWYDLAIKNSLNNINRLTYLNNKANVFTKIGDYKSAISIYDSILNQNLIEEYSKEKVRIFDNLTYAKWLLTGNINLEGSFKNSLETRINQNNLLGQISSYDHMSKFYENIDLKKSKRYATLMYRIATDVNLIDDRLEALSRLMHLNQTDLYSYKNYSDNYIGLKDSITDLRTRAKNQFAKIRYDSEKNRAENADLKIKSVQRQLELEKMKRQRIMSISFGFLFVMAVVFIYFQIKAKHKKDNLKQVYKTEARISKKVHDEVANDMYHIMTKLQNDDSEKEAVLDDLEKIYFKTRDISKENSSIDLNLDFGNVLNDLLLDYKNENVQIITRNLSKINWRNVSDRRKIGIYRVLQELMTNMKKHSGASLAVLSFSKRKRNIAIEYKDDGIGCKIKKNTGLQNAESRINTLNGSIKFESEINQGFRAKIIV